MESEFLISGKMNAFEQLAIMRKIAPALGFVDGIMRKENEDKPKSILILLMLSQISDEDSQFVINKCLSFVVRLQKDGQKAKLMTQNGQLMFSDIGLEQMLELTSKVIEDSLGDFLNTVLPKFR